MHLEVLIEELSAEPVVRRVVDEVLPAGATYAVRFFEGKSDLLGSLVERLRGYRNWSMDGLRVVVLVDRDRDDCRRLKDELESFAHQTGFTTRRSAAGRPVEVCNRIAVEELEAWLLGDEEALRAAFPRVRPFAGTAQFRDPDAIDGTWETAERLLRRGGYYLEGLRKTDFAERVAPHLDLAHNRSSSFRTFVTGVADLVAQ